MKVAVAQMASVPGDIDANLRKHLDVVAAARAAGVELLLFPELSLTGHSPGADTLRLAVSRDHRVVREIAKAAQEMVTVFGIIEEAAAAQFYNSAVAVQDGNVVFVHRKINLATYGKLEDGKHFAAGNRVDTFALTAPWLGAVMICADA